jgi:hypothetical protein
VDLAWAQGEVDRFESLNRPKGLDESCDRHEITATVLGSTAERILLRHLLLQIFV